MDPHDEKGQEIEEDEGFFVRVRGLPWSAKEEEVVKFLSDCQVAKGSVFFTFTRDGRPSGEAYVELASAEDKEKALKHNNQHMGKRYIEVFTSRRTEMEYVVKRSGPNQTDGQGDAVVRLRGLPFGCTKEEIAQFFSGYEIVPNGITLVIDHQGRTAGDAYVQFATQEIADMTLSKHMERIGHRYIEIFKSSLSDARSALSQVRGGPGGRSSRPGPYDRNDRPSFGGPSGRGGYGGRGGGGGRVKGLMDDEMGDGYGDRGTYSDGYGRRSPGPRDMGDRTGNPGSNHRSTTGHSVHMRGLPFQANEHDIADFFKPLIVADIVIHYTGNNRATGEADVDFRSHDDACEAMKKDKSNMQHRYIELFLNSSPVQRGPAAGAAMGSPRGYSSGVVSGGASSFGPPLGPPGMMGSPGGGIGIGSGSGLGMGSSGGLGVNSVGGGLGMGPGSGLGMGPGSGLGMGPGAGLGAGSGAGLGMGSAGNYGAGIGMGSGSSLGMSSGGLGMGSGGGLGMNPVGGHGGSSLGSGNWNSPVQGNMRGNWPASSPYSNNPSYGQPANQGYGAASGGGYGSYGGGGHFGSNGGYATF